MSYPYLHMRDKPHLYRAGIGWMCVGRMCEGAGTTPAVAWFVWAYHTSMNAHPLDTVIPPHQWGKSDWAAIALGNCEVR